MQPFQFEDPTCASDATANAPLSATEWRIDDQNSASGTTPADTVESIDLTAGWDDLDRTLAEATPPAGSPGDFGDLLQGFEAEGITPLDPNELDSQQEWQPRSADEWEADVADTSPGEADDARSEAAMPTPETGGSDSGSLESTDSQTASGPDEDLSLLDQLGGPAAGDSEEASESTDDQATAALSDAWGDMDNATGGLDGLQGYTEILRNLDAEQVGELAPETGNEAGQDRDEAVSSPELNQSLNPPI